MSADCQEKSYGGLLFGVSYKQTPTIQCHVCLLSVIILVLSSRYVADFILKRYDHLLLCYMSVPVRDVNQHTVAVVQVTRKRRTTGVRAVPWDNWSV